MKRFHRPWMFLLILWGTLSGCVTGSVLTIPRGLAREVPAAPPGAGAAPVVAVLDFSWTAPPAGEIGRDFDHARSIVWTGDTGKQMADLVAGALAEKGIAAVRAAGEADVPGVVPARVWGHVEVFRVNVKRVGTIKVEQEATTTLKIQAVGPGAPPGWASTVSTTFADSYSHVTPFVVYDALNGAANDAADEAVLRLLEAGVVSVPK